MTFRDFGRFLEILEDFRPARARRVRANLEKFGFLEDFSRFWKIFDPHVPEGFVQTLKSLDFWKIFRDFVRFFRPARARRVRANLEKFGFLEDFSRFWKIFDPHVPEGFVQTLKILDSWKIFRDSGRFFEILEDFSRFWKIFRDFGRFFEILEECRPARARRVRANIENFGFLEDFLRFWKIFDPHV